MISDMPCRFAGAITLPSTLRLGRPGGAIPPAGSIRRDAPGGNSLIVLRDAFRLLACIPQGGVNKEPTP
jgi:hypothetical protein